MPDIVKRRRCTQGKKLGGQTVFKLPMHLRNYFPALPSYTKADHHKYDELPEYASGVIQTTGKKLCIEVPVALDEKPKERSCLKIDDPLDKFIKKVCEELEEKFWSEDHDGALEFALLLCVHSMTYEQAKEVYSTFGDYIGEGVVDALLDADF